MNETSGSTINYSAIIKSLFNSKIIRNYKSILESRLKIFIDLYELDLLVVENALAIPMHIPFGLALTDMISATRIPTIAHHHDFYWERPRYLPLKLMISNRKALSW